MLSMTHMIVLFIVVLVVFGPHKLPELARGLGKLMAEFRKASTDFRSAFEQEMRDMERQQLQAERKRAADAAAAAVNQPATLASPAGTPAPMNSDADTRATEALVVTPAANSVARSESLESSETSASSLEAAPSASSASEVSEPAPASHDQQQPA
jgi:sec-independent protein translocase protein TatB